MRKKNFLIILSTFVILVFIGAIYFYFIYWTNLSKYQDYSSHSTTQAQEPFVVSINAFLSSINQEDEKTCFNLLSIDRELDQFKICESNKIITWQNPYDDYTKLIPVNVIISFDKNIFSKYSVKSVDINLLEDEDYMFFFDLWDDQDPNVQIRIKSSEDAMRKGYYFPGASTTGENHLLAISENIIDRIEVEGEEISIFFTASIKENSVKLKKVIEKVNYSMYKNQSLEMIQYVINKENTGLIEIGEKYLLIFSINPDFNVEEYINQLINKQTGEEYIPINLEIYLIMDY